MSSATPIPSFYERLGGEAAVRRLVDRFYNLMDTLPEAREIRALHPDDLSGSRDKLFWFLAGWFGGPPLYETRFGHPRLRARHLPFPIASSERNQWMLCMERALDDTVADLTLRREIASAFWRMADHMRNREDDSSV